MTQVYSYSAIIVITIRLSTLFYRSYDIWVKILENNEQIEKLEAVARELGISKAALSRRLIGGPSLIPDLKSGRNRGLSQKALDRLFNEVGVSASWWFGGFGQMFQPGGALEEHPDPNLLVEGRISPAKTGIPDDLPDGWIPVDTLPTIVLRYYPGGIPAGPLDLTDDHYELVQVPMSGPVRPGCIMIRVRGDSMVGAGIHDGDIICVDTNQKTPEDGDVVAVTVDGESTVKYWFTEGDRILLCPDSEFHSPIDVTGREIVINGLVVKVERWIKKGRRPKNGNGK